jgi:flagellar basal-body rod protein FlgB
MPVRGLNPGLARFLLIESSGGEALITEAYTDPDGNTREARMLDTLNLMNGLTQKMGYLQVRQRVLSENISNVNTPKYKAQDVKAPDFEATLNQSKKAVGDAKPLALITTSPGHLNFIMSTTGTKSEAQRQTYEVRPDNNSVSIEEQMMRASQTTADYALVTNLYNKNVDMLTTAIKG